MLRFFRNIRKKFIEQDNTRKYLLYAIGEIALVMIGILLALQVNNWNEERKLQQITSVALHDLYTELQVTKSQIEDAIKENNEMISNANEYITGTFNLDSLRVRPSSVFSFTNFLPIKPNFPVLERELTSDKLIHNQQQLNSKLREIKLMEENLASSNLNLEKFWNEQVAPYFIKKKVVVYFQEDFRLQEKEQALKKIEAIFQDDEYRNLTAMCKATNELAVIIATYLIEFIDTSLIMIEEIN